MRIMRSKDIGELGGFWMILVGIIQKTCGLKHMDTGQSSQAERVCTDGTRLPYKMRVLETANGMLLFLLPDFYWDFDSKEKEIQQWLHTFFIMEQSQGQMWKSP